MLCVIVSLLLINVDLMKISIRTNLRYFYLCAVASIAGSRASSNLHYSIIITIFINYRIDKSLFSFP